MIISINELGPERTACPMPRTAARRWLRAMLLVASGAWGACASSGSKPNATPSSGVAAGDELRRTANAWARAANERDGAATSEYFAENAIAMYPKHAQPTIGKEANRSSWMRVFATQGAMHPIEVDSLEVSTSGDMGYTYGRWHLTRPGTAGASAGTDVGGRFLAVWRPVGRGHAWRIVMLSANEHQPAPPM